MPYVTQSAIEARLTAQILNDALDDDGDGKADDGILAAVIQAASNEVDGYLAGLYPVPFPDPAPKKVQAAALTFTCEMIYNRRAAQLPDWLGSHVKFWREHLQKVGNREIPFDAASDKAFAPGAVIAEDNSVNAQMT
jgi:phage gp36-like protein